MIRSSHFLHFIVLIMFGQFKVTNNKFWVTRCFVLLLMTVKRKDCKCLKTGLTVTLVPRGATRIGWSCSMHGGTCETNTNFQSEKLNGRNHPKNLA
jgi:hypothetical protein